MTDMTAINATRIALLALALCVSSACGDDGSGAACSNDPGEQCPSGQSCVEGMCVTDGTPDASDPDTGTDPDGSPVDAPPMVDAPEPVPCTSENIQETLFMPRCGFSTCHDSVTPTAGLDLVSPDLELRVVGTAARVPCQNRILVIAGDPANSFLTEKVRPSPQCGNRMPIGGMLNMDELTCIDEWINSL